MKCINNQLKTSIRRGLDLALTKPEYAPPVVTQKSILAAIKSSLFDSTVPVKPIALNNEIFTWEGEIDRVVPDGELRPYSQLRFGKRTEHCAFEAADAGPCASGEFSSTPPGTGAEAMNQGMPDHLDSTADLAGHGVRPTLVVVPSVTRQQGLALIGALAGAIGCCMMLLGCSAHEYLTAGWAGVFAVTARNRIADAVVMVPLAAATQRTEATRFIHAPNLEGLSAIFTGFLHASIIRHPRTESNHVYNTQPGGASK